VNVGTIRAHQSSRGDTRLSSSSIGRTPRCCSWRLRLRRSSDATIVTVTKRPSWPLALVITLVTVATANGQTPEGGGIVYGANHAFAIQAPDGWVLDNRSGQPQALQVVFYPVGSNWHDARAVMYANTASKDIAGQETREQLIAFDISQFRAKSATLRVTDMPLVAGTRADVVVKRFEGDENQNFEAVAYIDEKSIVAMLILTARTESEFAKAYPAFIKLVQSYSFLTSNVHIK
jgi:hypothetical protein